MHKFPHAFLSTPALALASVLMMPAAASAVAVYSENFNGGGVGSEWSTNSGTLAVDTAANSPNEKYLGRADSSELGLSNQTVTLTLAGLAAHTQVTLTFDMIVMRTMDGNEPFTISAVGPGTLASVFFENLTGSNLLGGSNHGNGSGVFGHADAENSLGVTPDVNPGAIETALYRRSFPFAHSTSDLVITFTYSGLSSLSDESWAIDNVLVETNAQVTTEASTPATLPLAAAGLLGAAFVRRQRRKA